MTLAEAIASYQAGSHAAAADQFAALKERSPDDPNLSRLRGLALVRAGRTAEALPLLAHARRLAFGDPLTHLHYGIGLLQAGRPDRAAALFRRAAAMAPGTPAPWINLSTALTALDRPRAARAAARRALALAPDDADALYALGRAETACANPDGARVAFLACARARPGFADAWVDLGLACYRLRQVGDAIEAMRQALAVAPGHGAAEANLAAFMLLRGETEPALARLRGVLARDPGCVPARINLANALLLDREAAEALSLLEGPAPGGRDGAHWLAHRALALLPLGREEEARADLDAIGDPHDADILIVWRRVLLAMRAHDVAAAEALAERMAALAEDETAAFLEHRIIGHFELARFHDSRGRPDVAFGHWRRGHRLLGGVQPFSREHHAGRVAATIAHFDRARLHTGARARADTGAHARDADPTPVFIVGMPRSGTTLAEQILAAHPMVHGAGERDAIHLLTSRLGPDAATLAALDADTLTRESEAFLADLHALAPEAARIVDKMPDNARHLGFISALLPGARIIHCRRDPRDIGLSIFQIRFFGYHPYAHDLADLGWAIGQHERLMAHWRATLPVPPMEIALTDWIDDFDGTLARLLAFLDLPPDPACATFWRNPRRVRTASAEQVRAPVNARGIGRWRRYEAELAPMLAELTAAGLIEAAAP